MSEHDAILFANAAFYAAFTARDMAALEEVWAKDRPLSCVHPGRTAITGGEAVMRSWRAILENPQAPKISCHGEKIQVHGDTALVTCIEQLAMASGAQFLMATNVFVRTGSIWAMVHHQAGSVQIDPGSIVAERKPAIN